MPSKTVTGAGRSSRGSAIAGPSPPGLNLPMAEARGFRGGALETLRGRPPLRYDMRGLVFEPNPLCQAIHSEASAFRKAMPRLARGLVYRRAAACPDGGFAIAPGHTRGMRRTKRLVLRPDLLGTTDN